MKKRNTKVIIIIFVVIVATAFVVKRQIYLSQFGEFSSVIAKWKYTPIKNNPNYDIISKTLESANRTGNLFQYGAAGQSQYIGGDYAESIKTLKKGLALNPQAKELHFLLAQAYYNLAVFDMINRNKVLVKMSQLDEAKITLGENHCLRQEISFVFSGSDINFKNFHEKNNIDQLEALRINFYCLRFDRAGLIDAAKQGLDMAVKSIGEPRRIPILSFQPDEDSKKLLWAVYREIKQGEEGRSIQPNQTLILLQDSDILSLYDRLGSFLDFKKY